MNEDEIQEFLGRMAKDNPEVKKVQFSPLVSHLTARPLKISVDYLNEIVITIEAELGQAVMKIKDIINLNEGSVIELDKVAGEAADVLINQQRFGQGEVVIIGANFGLRIDSIFKSKEHRRGEKIG
jgi:flagellar motor switch protein FliN/FliY